MSSHCPRYVSTRDGATPVSFAQALLRGLAPDGGLYVPDRIPGLDQAGSFGGAFPEMAFRVLRAWLHEEVAEFDLEPLLADALSFPVPLVSLDSPEWAGVHILELFHGPTLSFKDFGARTMARLMDYFLRDRAERLTILVATSGDTGSAVADGFAGQDRIDVVLLYPKGQVSPVQERQLIVTRPGVRTFAVDGTFDDCQRLVKAAFQDEVLANLGLSSANSINIGRLLPQMLYYLWAQHQLGEEVIFCVPCGNLGNLTGGVMAALSGMPVRRFLAAHNANDAFPRYLAGEEPQFGPSTRTLSNAMDVGAPSNFERLQRLLDPDSMRRWIWGTSVPDAVTLETMRDVHADTGYLADPHTAVGLEAVRRYRTATGDLTPAIVLSTAHPAKFPDVVEQALDVTPEAPKRLARLWNEPTHVDPLAPTEDALREVLLELHATTP